MHQGYLLITNVAFLFPALQNAEAVAKAMASAAVKVKCDGKVTRKGALCLIFNLPPLVE